MTEKQEINTVVSEQQAVFKSKNFRINSLNAAVAERTAVSPKDWIKASYLWELSSDCSLNSHNRDWCKCRSSWCQKMSKLF